ncbi:hypothetical protein ACFS27_20225 [Promicromonospora vindobonensis]|uniref:Tripartite tricarboxylate transporter TctB family protein n=1 Tax=Promicromonospora vindobonensis TaxID=195748 RepID=A0ABW5VXB7_9MICO
MTRLLGLARNPESWAYVLLAAVGLVALVDGAVLAAQAAWTGPRSAAGWFIGVTGAVLVLLVALSLRQDARGAGESVVSELATDIIHEEEDAGRAVDDRIGIEAEPLPATRATRNLVVAGALILGWVALVQWIGFGLVTGLFCLCFIRLVARRRLWVALVAGVAIAAGLTTLFELAGVLLPAGALWYLI